MAYIADTRFEVYVSNSKRDDLQNVTGKYGSFADSAFTPDVCPAGFLVKQSGRLPLEGYESAGLKNGNSWYMVTAANGSAVAGITGDHTGIYASNTYAPATATLANGEVVNIPGVTLGLAIPADERGDFTELKVGEMYNFGAGNFSTLPSTNPSTTPYATISNGLWVAAANAPATAGTVYAQFEDYGPDKRFILGAYDGGQKITLRILRA